jgi:thiamine biosynthesis lipoprotein
MFFRFSLFTFLLILLLISCGQQQIYKQQFYVFGTLVGVTVWGVPEQQANQAVEAVIHDFQAMHRHWHAWQPSPLTELNQAIAAGQTWIIEEKSLLPLLKQAQLFYQQSEGLFNPAIGQLVGLWGFHQDEFSQTPPPMPAKIAELVALAPSMADIVIEGQNISAKNSAVQLDFGAFAKGYAVDLAIEKFRQLGIENAIINAGGNLKAIGQKGKNPWWIGIRHPSGQGVLGAIAISGEESVITSGSYERFREYNGKRYSHIIDPRTGEPATGFTSVTVIDQNGARADAAATALMVAGLLDWHRIAQQMEVKYVMLVDEAGTVYVNPAMAKRVQFPVKEKPPIVISEPLF